MDETDPTTQTVILTRLPIVLAQAINTNSLGMQTETFDSLSAGSPSDNGSGFGNFFDADLGATFTGSGDAGVVNGTSGGVSAAPFFGPLPGQADTTNYLSVGANGTETITFATAQNEFGLYWGSVDGANTIDFYNGTKLVAHYSGADVSPLFSDGNQGSFSSNGYVEFSDLAPFNKVVLGSGVNAFEVDNISAGFVSDSHIQLSSPITGTLTVSDADIGDTLTASVIGPAVVEINGSTTLPSDANVAALIDPDAVTFDSVTTNGGLDVLHWTYNPTNADLDFLEPGDTLSVTFKAQVNDGHITTGDQSLTVTVVGTGAAVVNGTAQNDTFVNVGGGVTIFGNGGQDTFAFKPGFVAATIGDFDTTQDKLDLRQFSNITASHLPTETQQGQDTLLTLDPNDTILLKHVQAVNLHTSDFILHA